MKKSLLAVAVAAALPVVAHAQTNVTMYGIADAGVGYVKTDSLLTGGGRAGGTVKVDTGIQSTSRWGIRGSEDLGGGLSAIFNAEAAWNVDDGTGGATGGGINFQRRSFVGLQGGFGQVYFGRDYTPGFYAGLADDINGFGLYGTTLGFNINGYAPIRYSNAIFYNTPTWGGLQIRTAAGNGTGSGTEYDTSPKGRDRYGEVAALYAAGPWTANAYFRYGNLNGADGSALQKLKQYGIGGGYKFGMVRLLAQVARSDSGTINTALALGAANAKVTMYSLGVGVRAGAGEVLLQGWQARFSDDYGLGGKPKSTFVSLAYTYPLSVRTNLYATYGWGHNQNGANLAISSSTQTYTANATGAVNTNSKPQAIGFGIRHQF